MSQIRGDYKSVWTALSGSKEDAYMVVSGYTDEDKFHADAEDTADILRETVGVKPDDVERCTDHVATAPPETAGVHDSPTVLSPAVALSVGADGAATCGVAASSAEAADPPAFVATTT